MSSTFRMVAGDPILIDNETFVDSNGVPIISAVGVITIRRSADYFYFNGTIFVASSTQLAMTKVGDAESPGDWFFSFPTGLAKDEYKFVVTDTSGNAANGVQQAKMVVDDELVRLSKIAAGGAIGGAKYDPVTSILSLFEFDSPSTLLQSFNCKDKDGNPAGFNPQFEKIQI